MPFFKWYSMNDSNSIVTGIMNARTIADLDNQLNNNQLSLLRADQISYYSRLRPISANRRSFFFKQLSVLLDAGVYLDLALQLLVEQTNHTVFRAILADIKDSVSHGLPLHVSCSFHPRIFGSMEQGLLQVGQETAQLAHVCALLAQYHEDKETLARKIRLALLLPGLTICGFLVIALLIILLVLPAFASIFQSVNQPLPALTEWLLYLSAQLQSPMVTGILMMFFSLLLIWYRFCMKRYSSIGYYRIVIPIIGRLECDRDVLFFLQSLAVLVDGKLPIVSALRLAMQTVSNNYIKSALSLVADHVEQGKSLYQALNLSASFISSDCIALLGTGQEASSLANMVQQATKLYLLKVNRRLSIMTTLLQPLLMVILGLLILGLIISIYLPIFNLSLQIT